VICSPIALDTDGAILLRQDGRASWASFHGSRMADVSSPWGLACFEDGATATVATNEDVVPESALREAQ
jgi:hypothetical protein